MNSPGDPDEARRVDQDGVRLEATAYAESTIIQAARDQHIHYGDGTRRTLTFAHGPDRGCPYPGLASFTADQAAWFFGRDQLTAALVARLNAAITEGGPIMVVAASGAGKSSLLRAGLLARVSAGALTPAGSRDWPQVVFTPGAHPMRAAASALAAVSGVGEPSAPSAADLNQLLSEARAAAGPQTRVVLVADQFEELFRLCEDEDERRTFISWLWQAASAQRDGGPKLLAACAVRADSYSECMRYPQISQALQDNQLIVGAMSADELRAAITFPARAAGLDIEPALTELLLADLGVNSQIAPAGDNSPRPDPDAGRLPLLAYALQVTWQQLHGSTLTLDGYKATGGIKESIARSAEEAFGRLGEGAQDSAREVFLRLVKIGAASIEDVRCSVAREDLAVTGGSDLAGAVIDEFTQARLLTQSRDVVQITHEALLWAWPRLQAWLNDDRSGQLTQQQTEGDAKDWDTGKRDQSLLYRGARLERAAACAANSSRKLGDRAQQFIAESSRVARRNRRTRHIITAVILALLVSFIAAWATALHQYSRAISQSATAQSEEMAADAANLFSSNAPLAMLIGVKAYESSPTQQASDALVEAASQSLDYFQSVGSPVNSVAFSPNGQTLAVGEDSTSGDSIGLWNTATGRQAASLAEGAAVHSVAFSPNGQTLAVGDYDGNVSLWDIASRQQTVLVTGANLVNSVAFSPGGQTLAFGDEDGTGGLMNIATGRQTATFSERSAVNSVAFSPGGQTLAIGDDDGTVALMNIATGRQTATLAEGTFVHSVAFSPSGRVLAVGDYGGSVVLWNIATGRRAAVFSAGSPVNSVEFSPDGKALAVGGSNGSVGLWNTATGQQTATVPEGDFVYSVAFSPDGKTLAVGARGGVGVWDMTVHQQAPLTEGTYVAGVAFSPDGQTLAVADGDGVGLWGTAARRQAATLAEGNPVNALAFSPDGRVLAAGDYDQRISLWDTVTRRRTATLVEGSFINTVAFSPDGQTLAVGDDDGRLSLWNTLTGQRSSLVAQGSPVHSVAFSTDGRQLAVGDFDGSVVLWNVATGQRIATLANGGPAVNSVAFSPDGQTLAAAGDQGVTLWSLATEKQAATLAEGTYVDCVAFSPDGQTLAVAGIDSVGLWDLADDQQTAQAEGSQAASVAFSRDGQALAFTQNNEVELLSPQGIPGVPGESMEKIVCGKIRGNTAPAGWAYDAPGQDYQEACPAL